MREERNRNDEGRIERKCREKGGGIGERGEVTNRSEETKKRKREGME